MNQQQGLMLLHENIQLGFTFQPKSVYNRSRSTIYSIQSTFTRRPIFQSVMSRLRIDYTIPPMCLWISCDFRRIIIIFFGGGLCLVPCYCVFHNAANNNNNNNNTLIYIAPACRMTSEALADSSILAYTILYKVFSSLVSPLILTCTV